MNAALRGFQDEILKSAAAALITCTRRCKKDQKHIYEVYRDQLFLESTLMLLNEDRV